MFYNIYIIYDYFQPETRQTWEKGGAAPVILFCFQLNKSWNIYLIGLILMESLCPNTLTFSLTI